jgi:hypothetical protein
MHEASGVVLAYSLIAPMRRGEAGRHVDRQKASRGEAESDARRCGARIGGNVVAVRVQ